MHKRIIHVVAQKVTAVDKSFPYRGLHRDPLIPKARTLRRRYVQHGHVLYINTQLLTHWVKAQVWLCDFLPWAFGGIGPKSDLKQHWQSRRF